VSPPAGAFRGSNAPRFGAQTAAQRPSIPFMFMPGIAGIAAGRAAGAGVDARPFIDATLTGEHTAFWTVTLSPMAHVSAAKAGARARGRPVGALARNP
jgi:hypothetical protein